MVATALADRLSRAEQVARLRCEAWRVGNGAEALRSAVPDAVEPLFSYPFPPDGDCSRVREPRARALHLRVDGQGAQTACASQRRVRRSDTAWLPSSSASATKSLKPVQQAFVGIWPESTQAELDRGQPLVDQVPPAVAPRSDRGGARLPGAGRRRGVELFPYVTSHGWTGRVACRAGSMQGRVHLRRMGVGSVFFVISYDTASATVHQVVRQGKTHRVVAEHARGTLRVVTKGLRRRHGWKARSTPATRPQRDSRPRSSRHRRARAPAAAPRGTERHGRNRRTAGVRNMTRKWGTVSRTGPLAVAGGRLSKRTVEGGETSTVGSAGRGAAL
jgi:hypothetical protein